MLVWGLISYVVSIEEKSQVDGTEIDISGVFLESPRQFERPGNYDVTDKESWTKIWKDLISVSWFWTGWGSHLEGWIGKSDIETFIDRNGISYSGYHTYLAIVTRVGFGKLFSK